MEGYALYLAHTFIKDDVTITQLIDRRTWNNFQNHSSVSDYD